MEIVTSISPCRTIQAKLIMSDLVRVTVWIRTEKLAIRKDK